MGCCLAEAPDGNAVIAVHAESHGAIPAEIIEVDKESVLAFLGRVTEATPEEASAIDFVPLSLEGIPPTRCQGVTPRSVGGLWCRLWRGRLHLEDQLDPTLRRSFTDQECAPPTGSTRVVRSGRSPTGDGYSRGLIDRPKQVAHNGTYALPGIGWRAAHIAGYALPDLGGLVSHPACGR